MKLLSLILFLVSLSTYGQKLAPADVLTQIIAHAETASLYREQVDWPNLKHEMHSMASEADSTEQLKPALDHMLKELGDDHGRIIHKGRFLSYYSGEKKVHLEHIDTETFNKIQSGQVYPFTTRLIDHKTGYVRIVGLPMGDNEQMSAEIQDAVCDLIHQGADRWIIDLRYNGGGNMFPMVEGIAHIIGDGHVGGTKGVTHEESSIWKIEKGDFFYDDQTVALTNTCATPSVPPIAVLTSTYTASSGEALAVILKQRENTRFFGQNTMGKITATDWTQIDEETAMMISVSYYVDRSGNVYDTFVDIDEEIPFDPKSDSENDEGIIHAMEWLKATK